MFKRPKDKPQTAETNKIPTKDNAARVVKKQNAPQPEPDPEDEKFSDETPSLINDTDQSPELQTIKRALAVMTYGFTMAMALVVLLIGGFLIAVINNQSHLAIVSWSDGSDHYARVISASMLTRSGDEELTKNMVRQYIVLRESITGDKTEMDYRWNENGEIASLETKDVTVARMGPGGESYRQDRETLSTHHINRKVMRPISVTRIGPYTFRAEYTTVDETVDGQDIQQEHWISTVSYQRNPERVILNREEIDNPTGIVISYYDRTSPNEAIVP